MDEVESAKQSQLKSKHNSRNIRQSSPDTAVFSEDKTKTVQRSLTKSKSAKLRKSICMDLAKPISSPRNTIRMTDEEKIQFISKANTIRKPVPLLEVARTGTGTGPGPVQYRRKESLKSYVSNEEYLNDDNIN